MDSALPVEDGDWQVVRDDGVYLVKYIAPGGERGAPFPRGHAWVRGQVVDQHSEFSERNPG
jgi:hypothetical protein